jgi:pyruvate dehydrogenase E2 component (dihydrolipoamide acetyltransferase)
MPIEIRMPSVAPSMTEGGIARWAKQVGEPVRLGEVLFEVETDKAVVEVTATQDGVLAGIVVPAGAQGVQVDALIALLAVAGEDPHALGALPATALPPASAFAAPAIEAHAVAPAPAAAAASTLPPRGPGVRTIASPLARRIAKQRNVDLTRIRGSGPNGRILKADVEAVALPGTLPETTPASAGAAFEDVPHSNVRRVIAERLSEAKRTIPHFYLTIDCDVDALLAARRQANEHVPGLKLSVNDFVVRAAALALRKVPAVNAAWMADAIRHFHDVDVAVAVATPAGLITPIVRHADRKSIGRISEEMRELAGRAKAGRLRPEEFQGGGFTISNLGMHGIRQFSAIVNPPQACILAVGAAEQRPVVRNGAIAVATLMTCTLSIDHRSVDGALGAEFLGAFKALIEAPVALVI